MQGMTGACTHEQVQGVFFRACTAEEAQELGLVGWVRNTPTGSVAGEAQGPESQLATFRVPCTHCSVCAFLNVHARRPTAYMQRIGAAAACGVCMCAFCCTWLCAWGQDWLEHKGSPASRIDRCDISDEKHGLGELAFASFEVRR